MLSACNGRGMSAEDAIVLIEREGNIAKMMRQHMLLLSLDIESAYPHTRQHLFLQRMQEIGLTGRILNFMRDFTFERRIRVRVAEQLSYDIPVIKGSAPEANMKRWRRH